MRRINHFIFNFFFCFFWCYLKVLHLFSLSSFHFPSLFLSTPPPPPTFTQRINNNTNISAPFIIPHGKKWIQYICKIYVKIFEYIFSKSCIFKIYFTYILYIHLLKYTWHIFKWRRNIFSWPKVVYVAYVFHFHGGCVKK